MILNIKCVEDAFIDDRDYLSDETIKQYNINSVYHAVMVFQIGSIILMKQKEENNVSYRI